MPFAPVSCPSPHPSRKLLAALLVLAWAGTAQAETSPYYIGASTSYTHDSNVFRLPTAIGDSSYSVGLLGGLDQPIGRQRVYASGVVRSNRFQELKQLDNTSYGVNAGLDWQTVEKLSGGLSYSANQNLLNYGGSNTSLTTSRNIEKSQQSLASIQYGMASLLVLQGSFTHRSLSYSDPTYEFNNGLAQDAVSAGISYRPSGGLTLGLGVRMTRGDYESNGSSFDRRDIDLTATWVPTGLSTVNSRLSFGKQEAKGIAGIGRDFSGATGFVSWAYQPTGKLQLNTWVSRDTGAESSFFNPNVQQSSGVGDTSDITNAVAFDATYNATAKIRVNAGARLSQRSQVNGALEGSDRVRSLTLGASYAVLRNLLVSCNVARETRSASGQLSSSYGVSVASCSAQITLQ